MNTNEEWKGTDTTLERKEKRTRSGSQKMKERLIKDEKNKNNYEEKYEWQER